jgi:alpha-D-ribose 1-methylphosphonate 5-phosphate C-P lyase
MLKHKKLLAGYNFALLDENSKREIRRTILKAIAVPGYQVSFASRELPIFYGWGTGGLQVTLSIIGPQDVLKVIDQGDDDSVNAVNLRSLIRSTTNVETTYDTKEATLIQSRHRVPEQKLRSDQILVLQVPMPEALRRVEPREVETRRMHAEKDYGKMYVTLYEDILHHQEITIGAGYPVMVFNRHVMSPSPIPRWDTPLLSQSENLFLFGAGREKKIYAVPPYTDVVPLALDDYPFRVEDFGGEACIFCESKETYMNELPGRHGKQRAYICSDTSYCKKRRRNKEMEVK